MCLNPRGQSQAFGYRFSLLRCHTLSRPAVRSHTKALSPSPRFELRRMRNTNGRKTAGIAIPTARIAPYFVYPSTNLPFKLDALGGIVGEYFMFPAVDTTKSKDVPLGLSGIHRKTPYGVGTGAFDSHYTLTRELGKRSLFREGAGCRELLNAFPQAGASLHLISDYRSWSEKSAKS
jgi:hypothetical protein